MQRTFYKSLDREVQILGLKGKWITIFIVLAVISVIFGSFSGVFLGGLFATILVIGLFVGSYFLCIMISSSISSRDMVKYKVVRKMPYGMSPKETLNRIYRRNTMARPDYIRRAVRKGYISSGFLSGYESYMMRAFKSGRNEPDADKQ